MPAPVSDAETLLLLQLDEGTASAAPVDSSSHALTFTLTGTAAPVTGVFSGARQFSGSSSAAYTDGTTGAPVYAGNFDPGIAYGIALMVEASPANQDPTNGACLFAYGATRGPDYMFSIWMRPDGHIAFVYTDDLLLTETIDFPPTVAISGSQFIAVGVDKTYPDSSGLPTFNLYLNGFLVASIQGPRDVVPHSVLSTSLFSYVIGESYRTPSNLTGALDAVLLKSTALGPIAHRAYAGPLAVPPVVVSAPMVAQLLPPGKVWNLESTSDTTETLNGIAYEFDNIRQRGAKLVVESDPRTAVEMLPDWERALGLPDTAIDVVPVSNYQKQLAITQKLVSLRGQRPADFITLAATMGYTATITDNFATLILRSGFQSGASLYEEDWAYIWQVTAHANQNALDQTSFKNVITRAKPSHTIVFFTFV